MRKSGRLGLEPQLGNEKILEYLLLKEIDPNISGKDNRTPLHIAVEYNRHNNINILLKYGANIDIKNNQGNTALMITSILGNIDIIKLLISKGANVNLKNNNYDDALSLAIKNYQPEAIESLVTRKSNIDNNHILLLIEQKKFQLADKLASYSFSSKIYSEILIFKDNTINFFLENTHNTSEVLDILNNLKKHDNEFNSSELIKIENCIKQLNNEKCYDNFIGLCNYAENDYIIDNM